MIAISPNKIGLILLTLLCAAFIAFKWSFLPLPYFWDESWVYTRAIYAMVEKGPSLMPGSIDADLYTGHPLMFYFLSALWMTIVGTDPASAHLFPMLLACLLFIIVYFLAKQLTDPITGAFAAILIAVQPITLAQSGMMLSEILLSIFSYLAIYFYIKEQRLLMIISLSCLLWTKEAGIALCAALALYAVVSEMLREKKLNKKVIKTIGIFTIPVVIGFTFYFIQYIRLGWFLFPRHTGWIDLSFQALTDKAIGSVSFWFWRQERWILLIIMVVLGAVTLRNKSSITTDQKKLFTISLLFTLFYLIFCASNFLSSRYLYCVVPIIVIVCLTVIHVVIKRPLFRIGLMSLLAIYFIARIPKSYSRGISDIELSYANMVTAHHQMVKFCEQQNLYNDHIATHFLMIEQLKHKSCGYLTDASFSHVDALMEADTRYLILSPIEQDFNLESLRKEFIITPLKKFEQGNAWCEIYTVKKK